MSNEQELSDNISFVDGGIEFVYKTKKYTINRPSALEAVKLNKEIKNFDKEDVEAMVIFYIEILVKHGLDKTLAESLDMFILSDLFRAINSPAVKKK